MINLEEAKNIVDEKLDSLIWDDGPGYEAASNASSLLDDIDWIPLLMSTTLSRSTYNYTTEQIKMTFENTTGVDLKEAEFIVTYDYEQIPVTIYDWGHGQKKTVTVYYSIDRDLDEEFDPYMMDYEDESFEFELADPQQQKELESVIDGTVFEHDYYPGKKRKERYGGSGAYAGLDSIAYTIPDADKAGQPAGQAKPNTIGNQSGPARPGTIGKPSRPANAGTKKEPETAEKTDAPAGEYKVRLSEKDGIYLIECPELGLTGEGLDNYEDTLKLARFMVSEMLLAGKPKQFGTAATGNLTLDSSDEAGDADDGAGAQGGAVAQDGAGEGVQGLGSQTVKWEVIEPNIPEYKAMVKDLSEKQYLDFETEEEAIERKARMDAAATKMDSANAAAKSAAINAANSGNDSAGCYVSILIAFLVLVFILAKCMGD